jgi:hypothetical protein
METTESVEPIEATPGPEQPSRPWAVGIGLLFLGIIVSGIANGVALYGSPGAILRAVSWAGYVLGVVIAGSGIHRVLWFGPSARSRGVRLAVTVLVTIPAFLVTALLFSVVFTVLQIRFSGS